MVMLELGDTRASKIARDLADESESASRLKVFILGGLR
jgi:hypothetical protein